VKPVVVLTFVLHLPLWWHGMQKLHRILQSVSSNSSSTTQQASPITPLKTKASIPTEDSPDLVQELLKEVRDHQLPLVLLLHIWFCKDKYGLQRRVKCSRYPGYKLFRLFPAQLSGLHLTRTLQQGAVAQASLPLPAQAC
jgi:hypothetical protein